jgi:hypothetical protein
MTTLGDQDAGGESQRRAGEPGSNQGALLSPRALVILAVSGCIGLLAGISAGIAAGMQTAVSAGSAAGIALGLAAGLAAMALASGATAATLHSLIGRSG